MLFFLQNITSVPETVTTTAFLGPKPNVLAPLQKISRFRQR